MAGSKKVCPECGEEFWAMHLPRHLLAEHGIEQVKSSAGGGSDANATASEPPPPDVPRETIEAPSPGTESAEVAPRKPGFMDRLRSRRGRGHAGGQKAPASREQAPKRPKKFSGKRVSLDSDISDIWGFAGRRLQNTPHFPTGRMLEYQAPAAGMILDRAVAGTLPDRLIFQPIARNRDKYEDVGFLLAGPMLTFTITNTQHQMQAAREAGDIEQFQDLAGKLEMLQEMFVWVARMMLPRLAEGVAKAREKEEKEAKAIAQAFPDLGTEDPIQMFITTMFEPPPTFQQEANQNGRTDHAASAPGAEGPLSV
jgi:hypothetical protein